MKLRHVLSILVVVITMTLFAPGALAEEVRITVAADPTELTEAGNVELSFSISNFSDYELHNISISSNGVIHDLGTNEIVIPMGGSAYDIRILVNVPDSQIGLEMIFTVSWIQGGEPMSQNVPVTIKRAADPIISIARTTPVTMVKQGETITIDYVLTNSTIFDMTDITVTDEQISDDAIYRHTGVLRAGNSVSIQYLYTMGEEDVVSAPIVTYTVNGKQKTFSAIEPMTLRMMLIKLSANVSLSTPTAAGVTFTLDLRNEGNQKLEGVQITDDHGVTLLNPAVSLEAGESMTTEYTVVPDVNEPVRSVSFTVTGTDPFGGVYTLSPDKTYEVYPFVDDTQIQTSLRADIIEPWTAESGSIKVRITLVNYSEVPISSVQITETTLGLVAQITSLQSGENVVEQMIPLGSPRNLAFSAKGVDPTGTMRELCAFTLAVAYEEPSGAATPVPTLKPDDGAMERTVGEIAGTLSKVMIVLGIIMLVSFIGMVVLSIMERSRMLKLKKSEMLQAAATGKKPRKAEKKPNEENGQYAKTIWVERDHRSPAGALPTARRSPSAFFRPIEVEYDDEGEYGGNDVGQFADGPGFLEHGTQDAWDTPIQENGVRNYVDVDYVSVEEPEKLAGPKTVRVKAEPSIQPKKRPSVKHMGGTSSNGDGSDNR